MIIIVYVHSSKENMYRLGEKAGLSEEALKNFMYACTEVKLTLGVDEEGWVTIMAVDDLEVRRP